MVFLSLASLQSLQSMQSFPKGEQLMTKGFIPSHGGYKRLLSYQKAEIVCDATVYFCSRFLKKKTTAPMTR